MAAAAAAAAAAAVAAAAVVAAVVVAMARTSSVSYFQRLDSGTIRNSSEDTYGIFQLNERTDRRKKLDLVIQ